MTTEKSKAASANRKAKATAAQVDVADHQAVVVDPVALADRPVDFAMDPMDRRRILGHRSNGVKDSPRRFTTETQRHGDEKGRNSNPWLLSVYSVPPWCKLLIRRCS